jgi:hypothetical protein
MSEISLPSAVNFSKLPYLPENITTTLMSVQATNGTAFKAGNVVQWDLPSRAGLYIDGKTMFYRVKFNYSSSATAPIMRCTPATAFIQKLDEYVGSSPVNSVYGYNQASNLWYNTRLSVADKFGQASALGFNLAAPNLTQLDSLTLSASQASLAGSVSFAAPLVCSAFSSADHYIPTGLMAPLRIQMTLAALADICTTGSTDLTDYQVSSFELCFNAIDMGPSVDAMVASMGSPYLNLKTTAWANAGSQQIASGTSAGTQQLVFNHRYQSITNAYLLFSGAAAATDLNAWGDSRDVTTNGTYQLQVGQQQFPTLPIDVGVNKTSVLQYLRECTGSIQDFRNSMSIGNVEFSYVGSSATATTPTEPAKFIVGFPLEKIQGFNPYTSGSLMSGVNASSTPIIANVRIGTATTTQAYNPYLIVEYTSIIQIDPMSRQVQVIC